MVASQNTPEIEMAITFTLQGQQYYIAVHFRNTFCAACVDCSLTIFNSVGQKVLPCIVLNSKISVLDVNRHHVMAVSSKGSLYVW